ncbi:hypothetical protein Bca101_013236 [Brassica carinata]
MYKGVVEVTKAEIIPYPVKFHDNPIFKITAVTSENLTEPERIILHVEFDSLRGNRNGAFYLRYYLCHKTKCPIEPGRPFEITLANVYAVQRDDHLSGEYKVSVFFYDNEAHPGSLDMYASFKFHASALAEFNNIPITDGVNVSEVEIWPFNVTVKDNPVFRIVAVTPKNISSSSTVSARMILEGSSELIPRYSRRGYRLCDSTYYCPIVPGTFVLTFPHPYWMYTMKAGRYRVEVQIVNQNIPFHVSMNLVFWFRVSEA